MTVATLGLTGLAVVLAGTLAVEVVRPVGDSVGVPVLAVPERAVPRVAVEVPVDVDGVLGRPLFAPSRRAPAVAIAPVGTVAVREVPRLTGVILGPDGGRAIFVDGGGGKAVAVGDGGRVGSYVVQSIAEDAVVVAGPDGRVVLRIASDPEVRAKPHVVQAVVASAP
jgi:hypothetical protein